MEWLFSTKEKAKNDVFRQDASFFTFFLFTKPVPVLMLYNPGLLKITGVDTHNTLKIPAKSQLIGITTHSGNLGQAVLFFR